MPVVMIHMLSGRTSEKKRELIRQVTDSVRSVLEVKPEHVRVILSEVPAESWGVAGLPIEEYRAAAGR